jgi:hypothetical protein
MAAYNQSLVAASLYVDYIFLDTDERRRMAQNPHEYLIEQLQFTGDESVGSSSNKIKLNFNHPCKELIWVVQPDENVDYCASLECGTPLYNLLGAQPFNYSDAYDALPNAFHAFGNESSLETMISGSGLFDNPDADAAGTPAHGFVNSSGLQNENDPVAEGSLVSDAGTFVLAETALNMHTGDKTLLLPLSFNLTDKTASRSARAHTLTSFSHSNTTLAHHPPASIYTRSLFALKNTNLREHAISRALTTLPFSSFSRTPLLNRPTPLRSVYTRSTTMCSAS